MQRAKEYLANIPGGTGAYSESKGAVILRKHVAKVQCKGPLLALKPFWELVTWVYAQATAH